MNPEDMNVRNRKALMYLFTSQRKRKALDFIVQGPYRTTPNRSSIPSEDADNKILARQTAMLLKDSIHEIKTSGILNMSFLKALPLSAGKV